MLRRSAVRWFSKQKGEGKGAEKPRPTWTKKLKDFFYPELCKDVPKPKKEKDMCAVDPSWQQPRVVIIGAGIAGLSTAQRLMQCGLHNFVILEATNRPGGRIHSRWMGDCMTEQGAMWIEGASIANQVFLLATQEGLLTPPLQRSKLAENTTFLTVKGHTIGNPIAEIGRRTFENLLETTAINPELIKSSTSLGDLIQEQLSKELGTVPAPLRNDVSRVIGCLYNELRSRLGKDPCYIRPKAMIERESLPGGRVRIPLGFGSVLAPLLRSLLSCNILYCKPVHYILWGKSSEKCQATVVCSDKEEFPADYVVVTIPLGVLKNDFEHMFSPSIPKNKIKAIKKLGFGDVERVFIQYERPFWLGDSGIGLGWTLQELREKPEDWRRGLGELTPVPGSYTTLQGTVGGVAAEALSDTTQSYLVPQVGELLRQFSGDKTLPDPVQVQCSCWTRDPFFNGAYTYLGLDSEPEHLKAMAEPIPNPKDVKKETVPPVLLFAGEATSLLNYSTVHGARESGIREAQRIIKLTNIFRGPPVCKPCPCPKKCEESK